MMALWRRALLGAGVVAAPHRSGGELQSLKSYEAKPESESEDEDADL